METSTSMAVMVRLCAGCNDVSCFTSSGRVSRTRGCGGRSRYPRPPPPAGLAMESRETMLICKLRMEVALHALHLARVRVRLSTATVAVEMALLTKQQVPPVQSRALQ